MFFTYILTILPARYETIVGVLLCTAYLCILLLRWLATA